mmetsp:Transcript_30830/g.71196  ORF Transcript_30830/g.71196 Transcript_30830/m.71196 type:complete len:514 (+) Transcript_30830:99-1640(+)
METDTKGSFSDDVDLFFASLLDDEVRGPVEAIEGKQGSAPSTSAPSASSTSHMREPAGLEYADASAHVPLSEAAWQAPPADADFSLEDRALRAALIAFYTPRNAGNLPSINSLVRRFRSGGVTDLWSQLAVKYAIPPLDAVGLLARTVYLSSIEQADDAVLEGLLQELRSGDEIQSIQSALNLGHLEALRALCSRGVPTEIRPQCWKALLGYEPLGGQDHVVQVLERKRRLFEERFSEHLEYQDGRLRLKSQDLVHIEIFDTVKDEVDATLSRCEFGVAAHSLIAVIFLYLASGDSSAPATSEYVPGMSDMAAVLLHVLQEHENSRDAEADCFWCFSALVAELSVRLNDVERTTAFVHSLVGTGASTLRKYDSDLSEHFSALEFEPGIIVMRWFMLLFARDASTSSLPEVLHLWDAFLADPGRFELPGYACVALLLEHRDDLLEAQNVLDLAEKLQQLPQMPLQEGHGSLIRKAWAICLFERRKKSPPFPSLSTTSVVKDIAGSFLSGIFTHF